ncbi:hypothetical protein OHA37_13685 [Streptomyces sp. NBC_00335]|uniref:hypothetical protein n=1 Tax=unclassified Streptomyces TaxID=2593676 RepID=UPI002251B59C|nr:MULTISPECIES: hypothetical protein [unclassified Streptomyces]MCX5404932.1 hypothetical protein [Streptomyces sp. NBC_00086]
MSDTTNNFGPVVTLNGGQGNIGINYGTAGGAAGQDAEFRVAVEDLISLLGELRGHLTPDQDRTVEEVLPQLAPDREALSERGLVLARVAQIAAAAGQVGQPVAEAVGRLLALIG